MSNLAHMSKSRLLDIIHSLDNIVAIKFMFVLVLYIFRQIMKQMLASYKGISLFKIH